jgi:ankyrin repeat domain-containing protein 50
MIDCGWLIQAQAALAEQEQMTAALAVVEVSSRLLLQCRIYEDSFTADKLDLKDFVGKDCLQRFNKDLVRLYVVILRSLTHILRLTPKHGVKKAIHAVLDPGAIKNRLSEINEAEIVLLTQVHICNTRISHTSSQSFERQLQGLQSQLLKVNGDVTSVLSWTQQAKRRVLLRWCSNVSYNDHHHYITSNRTKGTGEWVLQRNEFIEWLDSPLNSVLLLYGIRT